VTFLLLLAASYSALMLWRYGRRGILVVAPGLLRYRSWESATPSTAAQGLAGEALRELGFRRLGSRSEEGPLGGLGLASDSWADDAHRTYADVFEEAPRRGAEARLYFLSTFPDGAVALTANHPRQGRSDGSVEVAGLPAAGTGAALAAHLRTLERLAPRHGLPTETGDLGAREAAARAWYRAAGARELQARFLLYFVNALLAALILGGALHMLLARANAS